jgi:type IV pilus assembly protein PilA
MKMRTLRRHGFTLLELMIVVAILGLLASIAIPAFNKFLRRSRTSEADMNLRRLFDGAVVYFNFEYSDASGTTFPGRRFPGTIGPTPALVNIGSTKVRTTIWSSEPTWDALSFSLSDPHYFAYQFNSSGTDNQAQFTASAFGDLDSDTLYSTFVRFASVNNMEIVGSAGVYRVNEIE